jgi:enamine deaminase RidA (YjgF/YER057c/UK114 family)
VRRTGPRSSVFRALPGPQATELSILCSAEAGAPDAAREAEAAYRALAELLGDHGASFGDLASETLLVRDARRELPLLLGARARALAALGESDAAPLPTFIQQAPADAGVAFVLAASAVVPRHRDAFSAHDVRALPSCGCEGCARSGARLIRLGDWTSLHTANVYGAGGDALEQTWDAFCAAERLLEQCGMEFRDVVRTWIHLRDIDRDYDALNKARREFFRDRGIETRPASTGVQGVPLPGAHDVSLVLQAVKSPRPLALAVMSTPWLNEAWSYGVDFSRGLRIADPNKVTLHVSGTASIDEAGRSVHVGDLGRQVERMLDNLASLLRGQGAGFEDVMSAVVYVKSPGDAPRVRARCEERGFAGFPCALVEAPLCRPELLCEAEAVAMLPLAAA